MSSQLIIENLSFNDILKNVNLTLKPGTINALMGKNTSGKTLFLKSIAGLVEFDGIIKFGDIVVTKENIEEIRKKSGIYLGLTCLENKNVFLNLIDPLINLDYNEEKAKKKVYEITKKLGIENLLYKEINTLSYSQKKIVAFIQSIIHDPKIILIDGLFDSLDIYYKDKIISYLNQMKKNKKSIIIFTTNNSEDLYIPQNLIIINNGKILINGEVKEIIQDEKLFLKNDIKLPFLIDLSYKLKVYDLIDRLIDDVDEMVDEIWQ